MTQRERDGPGNGGELGDRVFRMVASAALMLGVGSGAWTISNSDDRYRAADAARDLQIRDTRIEHLQGEVQWLKAAVERIDKTGPTVGNQRLANQLENHEDRLDALERGPRP